MICKTAPQDQSTIKYNNMKMILDIIRDSREVSRSEIARMTGMSPTSATRIVGSLEECGLVRDMAAVSNGVGRKAPQKTGPRAPGVDSALMSRSVLSVLAWTGQTAH